jgi:hypothetical protein
MIVVNDGKPYKDISYYGFKGEIVQHKKNKSVGVSKNEALSYLLENNCTHIFLMEDDILIENENVFDKYIETSIVTGLKHLNFAYHGPYNKNDLGEPKPRKILDYGNGVKISLHSHLAGAFSYYTADLLRVVGLMDTFYKNAYEHLDHTVKIINNGFNPPFWWFPDVTESYRYFTDQDPLLGKSVIRQTKILFKIRYRYYSRHFKNKNGFLVADIPELAEDVVINQLNEIKRKYGLNE